jgi:hypothetical protein
MMATWRAVRGMELAILPYSLDKNILSLSKIVDSDLLSRRFGGISGFWLDGSGPLWKIGVSNHAPWP